MPLPNLRSPDTANIWMGITAISAAAAVNIYLIFLVVDANTGYRLGITVFSPALRAASISVIAVILFLKVKETRTLNLDFLGCAFLCYLIFGALVGLINNGPSYEFGRHLFAATTMLIAYWAGRFLTFEGAQIDRTLRFWAWISVLAGGLAWVIAYRMILSPGFSMSPVSQFLPLSVGLTGGSIALFALALLMIAFGNKRDVILGAAAIFAIMFIRRYLARLNAGLRIFAGAILTVFFALLIFLSVSQSIQIIAKLGIDLPANLAERSNRVMDFVGEEARGDAELKSNDNVNPKESSDPTETSEPNSGEPIYKYTERKELEDVKDSSALNAEHKEIEDLRQGSDIEKLVGIDKDAIPLDFDSTYWRLEKLSSARVSLAVSVYKAVSEEKYGIILGNGFGGSYTWRYWSDNLNAWQEYILYQCDLMPLWIFLTSGSVLTILLLGGICWKLLQIFVYSTRNAVHIAALLVIGSSIGMMFSFQPNVPLFWLFLGSMSARMQRRQAL